MNQKFASLGISVLLLSACSNSNNPKAINERANETNEHKTEIINQLNQLFEKEASLQESFEETLSNDPELTSIEDDSSDIITNLDQRQEIINQINELNDELQGQTDTFLNYDGDDLDTKSVSNIGENVYAFSQLLTNYTNNYTSSIESQRNYFQGISQEDASFEYFTQGLETVNQEHQSLVDQASQLEEPLNELDSQLVEVINQTEQLIKGE